MAPAPKNSSPVVPRGLLLALLAMMAVIQVINTCSSQNAGPEPAQSSTDQSAAD